MILLSEILMIVHVIGLVLAAGSTTVKLVLLFKCNADYKFFPVYFRVAPLITRLIITGMILLTLSGIAWIIIGYSLEPLLIIKIVVVAFIWILGPVIDNVAEPKLKKSALLTEQIPTPDFARIQKQHLLLEIAATVLMYAAVIIGVLL
ncbi:MAG TPA: hypothetical protein VFH08_00710 [Chitinophagaceae bacterium]|nr:hypothetical protein [Chitinophagaceae bacterium]